MTLPRLYRSVAVALVGAMVLTACGGDDDTADDTAGSAVSEGDDTAAESRTDDADTSTTAAETVTFDESTQPVADVYTAFFTGLDGDVSLLEDGDTFDPAALDGLRDAAAAAGEIAVVVDAVSILDTAGCEAAGEITPCAAVTYDLVVDGVALAPDQTGYAVQQDGEWKVSKNTFCALASLSGTTPEAC